MTGSELHSYERQFSGMPQGEGRLQVTWGEGLVWQAAQGNRASLPTRREAGMRRQRVGHERWLCYVKGLELDSKSSHK